MKSHIWTLAGAILATILATTSCKDKEDDPTSYPSLNGALRFEVPSFIEAGTKVTMVPRGISHPENKGIGYRWMVAPVETAYTTTKTESDDTDGAYTFEFGDSLGTYTVSCAAYATGYQQASASKYVVMVSPTKSLTGITFREDGGSLTDSRDGKTYRTVTLGGAEWMAQNLSWAGSGASYMGYSILDDIFGRYYTWDEACGACPSGWHLPSDAEWMAAAQTVSSETLVEKEQWKGVAGAFMSYAQLNGKDMWEYWPAVKVTNETGMSAIPVGYGIADQYSGGNETTAFWTSDEINDALAVSRYIVVDQPDFYLGNSDKASFAASVRCIKD